MSQPTPYTPTTDFSQQEANNASGRSTVNTASLDAEFANIETTVDDICENLALIQRDDGKLKDLTVMLHTLSPEVLNLMGGFNLRGLWTADTAYAVNDIASNDEYTYCCVTAHTSGVSFDGQYWIQFGFTGGADAAQAAANAQASANSALDSAAAASTSATNASNSASAASTSATNAQSSASAASTSESNAGNSATSASNSASAAATAAANLPNATTAGGDKFLKTNTGGTAWEYQTAAQARGSLGLVIGTNVQAYSANIPTTAASQAEMEAGTESALRSVSPLRVRQAMAVNNFTEDTSPDTAADFALVWDTSAGVNKKVLLNKFGGGGGGVTSVNGNAGAITAAQISAAATTGYGFTPASSSHNHTGVYAPMTAVVNIAYTGNNSGYYCTATRANGTTFTFYTTDSEGGGGT